MSDKPANKIAALCAELGIKARLDSDNLAFYTHNLETILIFLLAKEVERKDTK